MDSGKGELLSRTVVHTGRIINLELVRVKLPSGHISNMEIVRHRGSVVLLPIPEPGKIILIRQFRYAINRWIWELPAGSLEPGEDPTEGAARECEEEIGLKPGRVTRLRGYYPTPGFCDEEMIYFKCEDLQAPPADSTVEQDDDENIEPRTFTLDEARGLVTSGEIVDLKTLAGLTLL
jgi:ADP-ribose pyrophosphatase